VSSTTTASPGSADLEATDDLETHWLVRRPVLTAAFLLVMVQVAIRASLLRDSFFVTDDFMLSTRSYESPLDLSYLTRVHTGHFEPIGFLWVWVLAHAAPLSWGPVVLVGGLAQLVVSLAVLRLLVTLFGETPRILVPLGLFLFSALTIPGFLWWSAHILWLPLQLAMAATMTYHVKWWRHRRARDLALAVGWLTFGFLSFEKMVLLLPFLLVFSLGVLAARRRPRDWLRTLRTSWPVWTGYAVATSAFLAVYLLRASQTADHTSRLSVPSVGELFEFSYFSVLRTLVPGVLGGPWGWASLGPGGALADSPQIVEWLSWALALVLVVVSVAVRKRAFGAWLALTVYVLGSLVSLGFTRLPLLSSTLGLETRYIGDALLPACVVIGVAICPLVGETHPYRMPANLAAHWQRYRAGVVAIVAVGTAVACVGGLASTYEYRRYVTDSPTREFLSTAKRSVAELPPGGQIYDTNLPAPLLGAILFGDYDRTTRFVAPLVTARQRHDLYRRTTWTRPYVFDTTGRLRPMTVDGVATPPGPLKGCGWRVAGAAPVRVPLSGPAFNWSWTTRVGYIASGTGKVSVSLGADQRRVPLRKGLNQVFFKLTGTGDALVFSHLSKGTLLCVGDAQVGNAAPAPAP
jgi:hypothetical protein